MADGNLYVNGSLEDLDALEKKIDPENLGDEYCWQTDELLAAIEKIRELKAKLEKYLKSADELDGEMAIADKVMNSEPGDMLIFEYPQHGRDLDQKLAKKYLKKGEKYTIARIEVRSWSTDIFLEEIPGQCFNSVQFRVAP